eukprot:scaffold9168_cov126-Isochrysis_galbana.AAC.1
MVAPETITRHSWSPTDRRCAGRKHPRIACASAAPPRVLRRLRDRPYATRRELQTLAPARRGATLHRGAHTCPQPAHSSTGTH